MEIDYKKYDKICATGIQWLIYNRRKNTNHTICFTSINSVDTEDKWLLNIANGVRILEDTKIYVHINIVDYLSLKYQQGFKFLKYTFNPQKFCVINGFDFENELVQSFEETRAILCRIYKEYYKREK